MTSWTPAAWHPDPSGRFQFRYWDGVRWTEHVATHGVQQVDAPVRNSAPNEEVQRQVIQAGAARFSPTADTPGVGDDSILNESLLVVNQKGKLFEVAAEYAIYDRHGRQIGAVREVGQSMAKKVLASANRVRRLQIVDPNGRLLLVLTQPAVFLNQKMVVHDARGLQVGQIARKFTLRHVRFDLESGGKRLGTIYGETAGQFDFSINDPDKNEIGRITRTKAGLAKEMFTKADNYVVEIHRPLNDPLRSLVVATALAIDTALRQR